MNIYGLIIIAVLLIEFSIELITNYLNIKNLKPEVPDEFKDIYDEEKYARSQKYNKEKTYFGLARTVAGLAAILIFWFAGGFNWLDIYLRQFFDSMIIRGIAYIGFLFILQFIISLPFSIYGTFVIEEKYGFNKSTPKIFITDLLKSFALGMMIGAPLLAAVLWILDAAGENAWLYGWALLTGITFIMMYIGPKWIMPLFNKFEPLKDGELKEKILDFAGKVDFSVEDVYMMDGSKRSTKSNAFFTGFGKNKKIALFDTLIEKHENNELLAILAHEIGHYKKKHIHMMMLFSVVQYGIIFYLLQFFLTHEGLYDAFFMEHQPIYAGLLFFGMLYSAVDMIISIISNIISRKNEYQADSFAANTTKMPQKLIVSLKKLTGDNLGNLTPHPAYVFFHYSHPPALDRIKELEKIDRKLVQNNE